MSKRYVYPELFFAAGASIVHEGKARLALRWILDPTLGLPRALFHVWRFGGRVDFKRSEFQQESINGGRLVTWKGGGAVAVRLIITVTTASTVVLRAFSAANAAGHLVDERRIAGPVTSLTVLLAGSPVASITIEGSASISGMFLVSMTDFVNHPEWKLIETVGLPVTDGLYASTGYPLDPQGPVGAELPPVDAAIRRVKEGTPDTGWPGVTDRGTTPEPFEPPDPETLVVKELATLLEGMATVLNNVADPVEHADQEVQIATTAPRSVHGKHASAVWQARARPSRIWPLPGILLTGGSDPFGALALGFGTTLDENPQLRAVSLPGVKHGIYMVTVEHKVHIPIEKLIALPEPLPVPITVPIEGELAAIYLGHEPSVPTAPAGLFASAAVPPRLDPPGSVDGRWLQSVEVAWGAQQVTGALEARSTGYAVARGETGADQEMRTERRLSGGRTSFIPAAADDAAGLGSVRFHDTGVPEIFPGETPGLVYSVAAHDWFGRWSAWISTDYARVSVAPQIPAVRKVELLKLEDGMPTGSAAIEFTWDWEYRTPQEVQLRVLVHSADSPPPAVDGSVHAPGGAVVGDVVIDFSSATESTAPASVEAVPDESLDSLRTYRFVLDGLDLGFSVHPRLKVTARARGIERVVPGRVSAWSPDASAEVASPIPPPPPFVPAAMFWASVPDPRGVARARLEWGATAPLYAVYLADETALRRELNEPSADLNTSPAERLVALRSMNIGGARRAFRRVADRVPTNALEVALPRGSQLIHFYGIVPISSTGVEGPLPSLSNDFIAVAAPVVALPEAPRLVAREQDGRVLLQIEVPETIVQVARVEVYRSPVRDRTVSVEMMGPPAFVLDAASGVRSGGVIRWQVEDTGFGTPWRTVYYRAVAFGMTDRPNGVYGGKSVPTRTVEAVPGSPLAPSLTDLTVEDVASEPGHRLVSFASDVPLERTLRGAHFFTIQIVGLDASVITRRINADALPMFDTTLPTPAEQPDSIFRFDPVTPRTGRTYAWVPHDIRLVTVTVTDPAGRAASATEQIV